MIEMNLKDVVEWLVSNKYVTIHKGKPKFTAMYQKEITGIEKGLTLSGTVKEGLAIQPQASFDITKVATYKLTDWSRFYLEFITTCKIPSRIQGTHGDTYAVNKYSEEGMKAFRQAILEGYRLELMLLAVTVYYKSSVRLKKAVGNYMSSGEWKTDYNALEISQKEGNLADHIKQETKENGTTKYEWG